MSEALKLISTDLAMLRRTFNNIKAKTEPSYYVCSPLEIISNVDRFSDYKIDNYNDIAYYIVEDCFVRENTSYADREWTYDGYTYSRYSSVSNDLDIKETYDTDNVVIDLILVPNSVRQIIKTKILPKIGGSEFQFNIVKAQYSIKVPNIDKNFNILIPIGYVSFEQRVTSGSVDYSRDSISERTRQFVQNNQSKLNKLITAFRKYLSMKTGYEVEFLGIVPYNSLHRHPGKFGFSSIDKDKSRDNPGVLYIYAPFNRDNVIISDSVWYVNNDEFYLIENWLRIPLLEWEDDDNQQERKYVKGEYKHIVHKYIITNMRDDGSELYLIKNNIDGSEIKLKQLKTHITLDRFVEDLIGKINFYEIFKVDVPYDINVDEINPYGGVNYKVAYNGINHTI